MDMYKMEAFEIMADAIEEVAEWDDYEADMADMAMEDYASMIPEEYEYYEHEEQVIDEYLADYFDGDCDLEIDFDPYMGCYSYEYDCY